MRILELFSGIGAVSLACGDADEVLCAIDINQAAMQVYRANFGSPTLVQEISSLSDRQLADFGAELWWLSPPCQPFTRRGLQKDLADARTKPLLRLISAIEKIQPANIALENVIGFEHSETYEHLVKTLGQAGYRLATTTLCSTDFGLPNLRPRFFLVASQTGLPNIRPASPCRRQSKVAEFLDSEQELARWQNDLAVDGRQIEEYLHAINVVTPESAVTRCFTSAYGRSIVRSGSYLQSGDGFRRFSPSEESRLLGFPHEFQLSSELSTKQLWKLIGNSVSMPCARHVLDALKPQLADATTR
jgi:site-specific DNA-cytosine methylase